MKFKVGKYTVRYSISVEDNKLYFNPDGVVFAGYGLSQDQITRLLESLIKEDEIKTDMDNI